MNAERNSPVVNPGKRHCFATGEARKLDLAVGNLGVANGFIQYEDAGNPRERQGTMALPVDLDDLWG
jgi:hypothetical protein